MMSGAIRGRRKLSALKDATSVVLNKAKTNPGLGVPEDEMSDITTDEMIKNANKISYSPSKRTLDRCIHEVKVSSVIDGGFL